MEILTNYSMFTARCKYELLDSTILGIVNYGEADLVLSQWSDLVKDAQEIHDALPATLQPGLFEMVLHPCRAGYVVYQIHINAAKNDLYSQQGRTSANLFAQHVIDLFNTDSDLTEEYHTLLNGKWKHVLSQTHLGYQYWQQPMRNTLPSLSYVQGREISLAGALGVACEGNNGTIPGDDRYHSLSSNSLTLSPMDPYGSTTRWIEVFSRAPVGIPVDWSIIVDHPAVTLSQSSGRLAANDSLVQLEIRVFISVDWTQVDRGSSIVVLNITITTSSTLSNDHVNATGRVYGNYGIPQINLPLKKTTVSSKALAKFQGAFVESNGIISIKAEHFTSILNNDNAPAPHSSIVMYLTVIPGYGRTLSGITLLPYTSPSLFPNDTSTSRFEYDFITFTHNLTLLNVTVTMGPSLNTHPERPLRYAISISPLPPGSPRPPTLPGEIQTIQPVPPSASGTLPDSEGFWTSMVSNATMSNMTIHDVAVFASVADIVLDGSGVDSGARVWHLHLWLLEPGLVVQRILIESVASTADASGVSGGVGIARSYLGPPESYRIPGL